jgi:glycosyltransferase involved in cell wall biosynthesis
MVPLRRPRVDRGIGLVNVLYLTPTGMIGGAEMVLLDLLDTLRVCRPDWGLKVLLGDNGPFASALGDRGIACEVLPLPAGVSRLGDAGLTEQSGLTGRLGLLARGVGAGASIAAYLAKLRLAIKRSRPDCLQTNGMKAHLLGTLAAPRSLPIVWHVHDYLGSRALMGKLLGQVARRGVRGVAVSRSVEDDARATLRGKIPITTIENAVDTGRFDPSPIDGVTLDRASGLEPAPQGTVRVGLVATYAMWKGHELFLQAAAKVTHGTPTRFYIVGGPIYRSSGSQVGLDSLRSQAHALGLDGRVGFVGHQSDPAPALRALDVVVHASVRPEPFGRVIVEGMSCGKAVIAMEEGGAAGLIRDDVDALACPPRDADALADRIDRLVGDPALRGRLGLTARQTALDRFDRSRMADPWTRLYESLEIPRPSAVPGDGPRVTTAPDARPA